MSAPPARPAYSVSQPALLPISSTTMQRLWLPAVVCTRSMTSVAMSTAEWKPKVTSVPQMSLSMVLGRPMTFSPSSARRLAVLCVPLPPRHSTHSSCMSR